SQRTFDLDFFKPYVSRRTVAALEPTTGRPTREDVRFVGAQIAAKWLGSRGREARGELLPGHPYLPGSVDQDLLVEAEGLLQYSLRGQAALRRSLRDGFWDHLRGQYWALSARPRTRRRTRSRHGRRACPRRRRGRGRSAGAGPPWGSAPPRRRPCGGPPAVRPWRPGPGPARCRPGRPRARGRAATRPPVRPPGPARPATDARSPAVGP